MELLVQFVKDSGHFNLLTILNSNQSIGTAEIENPILKHKHLITGSFQIYTFLIPKKRYGKFQIN